MQQHWHLAALTTGFLTTMALAQAPTAPAIPPPSVQAATKGALIKIDGRFFVGIYGSEKQGKYPNRALDVPDAKLRFTFTPGKDIAIVNRFSNNGANNNGFDYFYLDLNNWGGALPGHLLRLGKIKTDFGEETWTDNPEESYLITNSAASVGGYDGGINVRGPISKPLNATYSLAVLNGIGGLGASTRGLGTAAKIGVAPTRKLYLSASVYDSGDQMNAASAVVAPALKIANLQAVPTGATGWRRTACEVDARWNYGTTGIKAALPSAPSPHALQLAAAAGHFNDDFSGPGLTDRGGNYWYAEAVYHATRKVYVASRYSEVSLEDNATAKLVDSPIAVNAYQRLSLGVGYHLTPLTDLKVEYTDNSTNGGTPTPNLNQFAVGIATKF